MADDRIQLNLVLNEATVSAVEGRVRNLVNRLNNQNISLNIDARNLNNIENQFNRIQQQMQTINATPVNINANLTSAQQQYRLETERMRVSQQLELSRQRTLQTENQAISALAQQNRTLTVNNNITHQIEQGAQNIGNNMNVAGGHARDFVDYLADGVRYIIVYRSLYEIMNQVGEAFSEMKNVDKELISVRKTTGMAENEIEKIRKASYGVATEYGRTASEYLGSVSEFARGGYKELSTELAKVSLLTQNVGDVSADSANKMLLSVDAAYKLKGNVTELTNVVNGLNNIANLNPTSLQKMADGMQVSASMAKVAGLEISDLVALIGTGTAVTQREGGEIARAIRTIMMNIRQVKGELEDGTVIDDDSIAKAEAALSGVGIATKEVVNGVRELRDPMDILDELAGKWSTLNTEAQSVVLEGLANKRQANVLAAILENYEMVGKMQSEYLNSANSAVKENELYLLGWEATQKRVSAKWTEFIANMADTAVITGSLNALYGVLVALDTPIGRIATSIVLVNTALAVSGRLWQAIRARSIVADILSMGVAERNLGTAIQLVTGHLGRQALAWATSPMGMATIAVAGITLITSAIKKNSQKLEENAQKAGEAYDKVKSNMNELDSLIKQYNDLQISNEWNNTPVETKKQLHEDINRLLGDEADKIDILNGKYKETTEELFKQRMAKLPEEEKTAFDNEQAKGKTLWDTAYWNGGGGANGYSYGTMQATDAEKKYIEKYDNVFDEKRQSAGHGMAASDYVIRFDNFNDFMTKYEETKKMLQELYNDGMGESDLYKGLNDFIAKFDTKVDEYKTAVEELEKTKAGQKLGNYITQNVGGYIDNLDEYNKVVDWIKNNFTGEDKNSALSFLNSYFSEYADQVDATAGNLKNAIVSLSDLKTTSDDLKLLGTAFNELSDDGHISLDTLSSIQDKFKDSVDDIDSYIKRLSNAKVGSEDFNNALAELTDGYINAKYTTEELAEADENLIAAMLDEAGVSNSLETATFLISRAKEELRIKTDLATATSWEQIAALATEAQQAGITGEAFNDLVLNVGIFNNTNLNVADKIAALQELGYWASWSATQIAQVDSVKRITMDGHDIIAAYDEEGRLLSVENVKTAETPTTPSVTMPKYTPSGGGGGSGGGGSNKNEKLENALESADEAYKIHQDELRYIEDLQKAYDKFAKTDEERAEILEKIEQARQDYAENRIKDLEHENKLLEKTKGNEKQIIANYEEIQRIAHEEAERYRQYMRDLGYDDETINKTDEIQGWQDAWWDAEEAKTDAMRQEFDDRLQLSEDYIEHSKNFGWENGDSEIEARKRILEWIESDYYRSLIKDDEEYYDILAENRLKLRDALQDTLSDVERHIDLIKEEKEDAIESLEEQIEYKEALLSINEKQFDVINKLNEAQHEANKAIATSRVSYSYLDEDMIDQIYNEEDYAKITDKITAVGASIDTLTNKFIADINDAYKNDNLYLIETITAQYERQCAVKERELEVLQAEIDLQKKQDQLNNVLAEKNVRMLKDGEWIWTHNVDNARQAAEELADAQYQLDTLEQQQQQQAILDSQQLSIDRLNAERGAYEKQIEMLDEQTEKLRKAIENITDPLGDFETLISSLVSYGNRVLGEKTDSLVDSVNDVSGSNYRVSASARGYDPSIDYMDAMQNASDENEVIKLNEARNAKIDAEGLSNKGLSNNQAVALWKSKSLDKYASAGYASGTKDADKGLARINEILPEGIMTKHGTLIPMANFDGGEMVFNHKMMENLWQQAQIPLTSILKDVPMFKTPQVVDQSITFTGDITVNQPADLNSFLNDLTTQVKSHNAITNRM